MVKQTKARATQDFVPVREVRDGVAVLDDGTLCAVLIATSINFALKSEDEQMAILMQFQNFLNSLDFSTQFLIQSRELDIRPYTTMLEEVYREQTNDLLKIQTREYIEFVKAFTESTNIMTKSFFVVVPYTPSIANKAGGVGDILSKVKKETPTDEQNQSEELRFEEYLSQLMQRVAVVEQGLTRTGVRMAQLGTEELIELFYRTLNPGEFHRPDTEKQKRR